MSNQPGTRILGIEAGYTVKTDKGDHTCTSLVIATGGLSIPKIGATNFGYETAKRLEHTIVQPRAALVPLTFDGPLLERGIGIKFNGAEKTNCEEYCLSEGWVRLAVGKTMDRFGKPMTVKLKGKVEPFFGEEEAETPA